MDIILLARQESATQKIYPKRENETASQENLRCQNSLEMSLVWTRHLLGDPATLLSLGGDPCLGGVGGRRAPPTCIHQKIIFPLPGNSEKERFYQVTEGCQSPQNQAQKRGCLIIYASMGAHEDHFTLSPSDQDSGRGWSPNQTTGIEGLCSVRADPTATPRRRNSA
jgi:hypothetical protein